MILFKILTNFIFFLLIGSWISLTPLLNFKFQKCKS